MNCPECSRKLAHDRYGNSWCENCVPVAIGVASCRYCAGRVDEYHLIEDGGDDNYKVTEHKCAECGKLQYEDETEEEYRQGYSDESEADDNR